MFISNDILCRNLATVIAIWHIPFPAIGINRFCYMIDIINAYHFYGKLGNSAESSSRWNFCGEKVILPEVLLFLAFTKTTKTFLHRLRGLPEYHAFLREKARNFLSFCVFDAKEYTTIIC